MRMRRKITACGAGRPVSRRYCLFYAAAMAELDSRADTAKRCALQKSIKSHLAAEDEQSRAVQSLVLEWSSRQDLVTAKTGTEQKDMYRNKDNIQIVLHSNAGADGESRRYRQMMCKCVLCNGRTGVCTDSGEMILTDPPDARGPGRAEDLETTAVLARGIGRYGLAQGDADRPTAAPRLKGKLASVAVLPCCCDTFM